ncbi:MAG: nicotinate (nicotinamide) nucleotide adenylyltransferase [Candidatus Omnitrophica bacterium]|nr:nicotinate (nicotinamide) nucleotide adenylyltransferase [Candidatus Omnitrophota bacterium]
MKIGILGGTFDPIHKGHLALAREAKKEFGLDRVFFVPSFIPPTKSVFPHLTPAPYRYRMVELALENETDFEICDEEFKRPDVSYTVDTLEILQSKFPGTQLYLILGGDSFNGLLQWKGIARIRELAGFIVAPREGAQSEAPFTEKVNWIKMPIVPISSSVIRSGISSGNSEVNAFLPKKVEQYIHEMKLYEGD